MSAEKGYSSASLRHQYSGAWGGVPRRALSTQLALIPRRQLLHCFHHRSTLVFVQTIISDLLRLIFQELDVYGGTSSLRMVIATQPNRNFLRICDLQENILVAGNLRDIDRRLRTCCWWHRQQYQHAAMHARVVIRLCLAVFTARSLL